MGIRQPILLPSEWFRQSLCQTLSFEDKPPGSRRYDRLAGIGEHARGSSVSNDYQDACKFYTGRRAGNARRHAMHAAAASLTAGVSDFIRNRKACL